MNKTFYLLGLLVLLVATAFYFIRKERAGTKSFDAYAGDFAIEDVSRVDRIFIARRDGATIDLRKGRKFWTVNEKYRARSANIKLLLETLAQVEIKYIPPRAAVDNITREIAVHGIKVEVYDVREQLLKSYYVGGSTSDERGTHMIMQGSNQPFVTHIPSMDGGLRARFNIDETDWRDRRFLSLDPAEIHSVAINYPRDKEASFFLKKESGKYSVKPLESGIPRVKGAYREGSAENYVRRISNVACESFENGYPKKDSIRQLLPFCSVQITLQEEEINLKMYPAGPVNTSEFENPYFRMFVDIEDGDFMLGQYAVLQNLLREYNYFYKE